MLGLAKKLLSRNLKVLAPYLRKGTPIIFAEPSCKAVFKDELLNLFPNDLDAKRLSEQCYSLAGFMRERGFAYELTEDKKKSKISVHNHCHQKSLEGNEDQEWALKGLAREVETLDTGCCGMAGILWLRKGKGGHLPHYWRVKAYSNSEAKRA